VGPVEVSIGIDIGQKVDPTALAVLQRDERGDGEHFVARFLERLPLGTSYPDVATRLQEIVANVQTVAPRPSGWPLSMPPPQPRIAIYADATGVGLPVVDVLREGGLRVVACTFTHGQRRTVEGERVTIGKAWLVSRLQALLQTERVHLPPTDEARMLAQELLDYEIDVDEEGDAKFGAFKVGTHDDLVTALGLAAQPPAWRGATLRAL
jgi:hypothetical protein